MEPGNACENRGDGSAAVAAVQGQRREVAVTPANDIVPRFKMTTAGRVAAGLDFPIVAKVTREERQAVAARALSLGRGLAEHLRSLIRQDLENAAAGPSAPPNPVAARPFRGRSGRLPKSVDARFWAKVDKRGEDECWEWKAARSKANYGLFSSNEFATSQAHRVAWMLANESEIPPGMVMMHKCDNPPCCNPNHLRPGTSAENSTDKAAKDRGRSQRALNLTYDQAMEYRNRVLTGDLLMADVARETGLSHTIVSRLLRGQQLTADFKRLPAHIIIQRRQKKSVIKQTVEAVLGEQGGLSLDDLWTRLRERLGQVGRASLIVYLKTMRQDGEVVFTGRRSGARRGMRGGQLATTRYYLPGTVPEGAVIRPSQKGLPVRGAGVVEGTAPPSRRGRSEKLVVPHAGRRVRP
jgi:hypothetical protein